MTRQVQNIRRGMTPAEAYGLESANKADPERRACLRRSVGYPGDDLA